MNTEPPFIDDLPESSAKFDTEAAEYFGRKAGATLLIALGIGLAAAALVHAFRPQRPRQRVARLIEDMEDSFRKASAPAVHRVGAMASDGAHALGDRFSRSEAQFEKFMRGAARRLRQLTSAF
jgi:hypothetical protein